MKGPHVANILIQFGMCLGFAFIFSPTLSAPTDGQVIFEKRCIACHKQPDIHTPPPEGWAQKLDQMAPLAKLKRPQKEAVLSYLLAEHSEQMSKTASREEDQAFFEEKCSRCHTLNRILLEPLTDESLRHVVNRMQAKSGTDWLTDADVERILNYLNTATLNVSQPPRLEIGTSAEDIFTARCQTCHSLESIAVHLEPNHTMQMDWPHIIARMRGKAPQWMSKAEAEQIVNYLQSLSDTENK